MTQIEFTKPKDMRKLLEDAGDNLKNLWKNS